MVAVRSLQRFLVASQSWEVRKRTMRRISGFRLPAWKLTGRLVGVDGRARWPERRGRRSRPSVRWFCRLAEDPHMAVMRAYMWGAFIPDRVDLSALMRCQTHSPPAHHPPQPLASSLLRLLFSSSPHQLGTSSLSSRLRSDSAGVGDTPSLCGQNVAAKQPDRS